MREFELLLAVGAGIYAGAVLGAFIAGLVAYSRGYEAANESWKATAKTAEDFIRFEERELERKRHRALYGVSHRPGVN